MRSSSTVAGKVCAAEAGLSRRKKVSMRLETDLEEVAMMVDSVGYEFLRF